MGAEGKKENEIERTRDSLCVTGAGCFIWGALPPFSEGAGVCCWCASLRWRFCAQGAGRACCCVWEGEEGGDKKLDGSHVAPQGRRVAILQASRGGRPTWKSRFSFYIHISRTIVFPSYRHYGTRAGVTPAAPIPDLDLPATCSYPAPWHTLPLGASTLFSFLQYDSGNGSEECGSCSRVVWITQYGARMP